MLSVRDFEPATPTPALTTASTPSSSPERASPLSTSISGEKDFSKPVRFSLYPRIGKDLRIEVGDNDEEVMVEIREWHRGVRSFKVSFASMPRITFWTLGTNIDDTQGISIPVGDAGELVKILPEIVRLAEIKEEGILKADLQREAESQKEAVLQRSVSGKIPEIQIEE
jgi:hypothetical protein